MKKLLTLILFPTYCFCQPIEWQVVSTRTDSPMTTVGNKLLTINPPVGIRFLRYNADEITFRTPADMLSDIGAASSVHLHTTSDISNFPTTTSFLSNSTNKNFVTDAQAVVIGNTSGTNTGDNAANTTYANDYRAANFVAGTNYLAPNGSAASLTNFPTLNQNTTGSAATLTTPRTIQGVSFNGSANINIINGTGFVKATGTTISYDNSTYQPLAANLTAIGALANGNGFLKNNGSGVFSYENPAGAGTVTDVSIVTANGISGSVATSTSTPAVTLTLGAITPTTVNGVTITDLLPKTTTSGAAQSPTASGTQQITHDLGRTPTIIRIYGIGAFTNSTSATPTPFSMGVFTSSGNTCVYMTTAGTTAQASQTSTTFSVFLATTSGNNISGVIQNITATTFDIVWTETGTALAQRFIWEAQ